jgi:hypothetical protein
VEHGFCADIAARAGAVLDHERLAEPCAQPLCDDARSGVDAAARCDVDDDLDRPAGIIRLRLRRRRRRQQRAGENDRGETAHLSSRGPLLNACFNPG